MEVFCIRRLVGRPFRLPIGDGQGQVNWYLALNWNHVCLKHSKVSRISKGRIPIQSIDPLMGGFWVDYMVDCKINAKTPTSDLDRSCHPIWCRLMDSQSVMAYCPYVTQIFPTVGRT